MEYGPETYGETVADVYDEWHLPPNTAGEIDLLTELAAGGRALELGIGTGRVAIPLRARGVDIHGVDSSPAMVEKMRAKPDGASIPVAIGNMADVPIDGPFTFVFVVYNTFFMLMSQEEQVRCFGNVAARLASGGRFLIHAFVPDLSRIEHGDHLSVRAAEFDKVHLDASTFDRLSQTIKATQMRVTESGTRLVHTRLRYAFPPELDLMAQLAGLTLESRWSTYTKAPFTAESVFAVSVYRKA
jgi:SAM-dependent methyltransferase